MYDIDLLRKMGHLRIDHAQDQEIEQIDCPIEFGECWSQTTEYVVDDFLAEVGFWLDVFGFIPNALSHDYAMFTCPKRAFFISFVQSTEDRKATEPDCVRFQFMVQDIDDTTQELIDRGVQFFKMPTSFEEGSPMKTSGFLTPSGMVFELWGF